MSASETAGPRMDWNTFQEAVPEFALGMAAVTRALRNSSIEPVLRELIKIRASQLNGCAYCVQFHLNDARKLSIPSEKLDLLAAWRDAGIYSPRELAALEWTEHVTLLAQNGIGDEAYARLSAHFDEKERALLTVTISQINAWNRIAAPLRFPPPIPEHALQPAQEAARV